MYTGMEEEQMEYVTALQHAMVLLALLRGELASLSTVRRYLLVQYDVELPVREFQTKYIKYFNHGRIDWIRVASDLLGSSAAESELTMKDIEVAYRFLVSHPALFLRSYFELFAQFRDYVRQQPVRGASVVEWVRSVVTNTMVQRLLLHVLNRQEVRDEREGTMYFGDFELRGKTESVFIRTLRQHKLLRKWEQYLELRQAAPTAVLQRYVGVMPLDVWDCIDPQTGANRYRGKPCFHWLHPGAITRVDSDIRVVRSVFHLSIVEAQSLLAFREMHQGREEAHNAERKLGYELFAFLLHYGYLHLPQNGASGEVVRIEWRRFQETRFLVAQHGTASKRRFKLSEDRLALVQENDWVNVLKDFLFLATQTTAVLVAGEPGWEVPTREQLGLSPVPLRHRGHGECNFSTSNLVFAPQGATVTRSDGFLVTLDEAKRLASVAQLGITTNLASLREILGETLFPALRMLQYIHRDGFNVTQWQQTQFTIVKHKLKARKRTCKLEVKTRVPVPCDFWYTQLVQEIQVAEKPKKVPTSQPAKKSATLPVLTAKGGLALITEAEMPLQVAVDGQQHYTVHISVGQADKLRFCFPNRTAETRESLIAAIGQSLCELLCKAGFIRESPEQAGVLVVDEGLMACTAFTVVPDPSENSIWRFTGEALYQIKRAWRVRLSTTMQELRRKERKKVVATATAQ